MSDALIDTMLEKLKEDFPPEALSEDKSRGFVLTSIKAAYVVERLNDVFGIFGWSYTFDPFELMDGEICTVVHLHVSTGNDTRTISQAGGKKPATKGGCPMTDARKSAITDGLTKCASVLGIGHKIFKGQQDVPVSNSSTSSSAPPKQPQNSAPTSTGGASDKQRETIGKMLGASGYAEKADRLDYVNEVLRAEGFEPVKDSTELTSKQASKVIGKLIDDKKLKDAVVKSAPEDVPVETTTKEPF